MNALLLVLLLLVLIVLVGNTLLAVAFLRGRGGLKSIQGRDREATDELHERVQALPPRRK